MIAILVQARSAGASRRPPDAHLSISMSAWMKRRGLKHNKVWEVFAPAENKTSGPEGSARSMMSQMRLCPPADYFLRRIIAKAPMASRVMLAGSGVRLNVPPEPI